MVNANKFTGSGANESELPQEFELSRARMASRIGVHLRFA